MAERAGFFESLDRERRWAAMAGRGGGRIRRPGIEPSEDGSTPDRQVASGPFLVVEDDVPSGDILEMIIRPLAPVRRAHSVAEAKERLEEVVRWAGLVIDVELASYEGSGFDVLEAARVIQPDVPALVMTGHSDSGFANRAFGLHAMFLQKPPPVELVRHFVHQALGQSFGPRARVASIVRAIGEEHALDEAEVALLHGLVTLRTEGAPADVSRTARSLLLKTRSQSLDSLALRVLRRALED